MLNVGKIEEGFVLDHIEVGKSLSIYHHLELDKLDCTVAIIKNANGAICSQQKEIAPTNNWDILFCLNTYKATMLIIPYIP